MSHRQHPVNEQDRLSALKELNIIDTAPEQDYDDIVRLASQICKTPISLITLLDEQRQWFKANHGMAATQTPRDISFCTHAIRQGDIMIVPDASKDERFTVNPLVTSDPGIRFYAGVPIHSEAGFPLGTLCVIDHKPHTLTSEQVFALQVLAKQVQKLLVLRAKIGGMEKAEAILKIREEKYRRIITNMHLGLLEVDKDEKILFANESFCEMSGYQFEELKGKTHSNFFIGGETSTLLKNKNETETNIVEDAFEIAVKNKNGQVRWWLISGAPRFDDAGQLNGYIGIHLDITRQKKLELELTEAREHAEDSTRSKEIFLANMSHEIRTPMNAIVGMANQLAKTTLDTKQLFYLDTIHAASENLLVIINDILDLSKIEAGKLQLERIGFDPREILHRAIRVLGHKAEEKGLTFTSETFDEAISPVLMGDPFRLNQVLLNLINNAIKFTEKGSIDISCNLYRETNTTQLLRVAVKDTGIGMDQNFVRNLFEKFSQEDASVTRQYGGTGLGMSICRDLVELMKGRIEVQSKKGAGTTIAFTIEFDKGTKQNLPVKSLFTFDANMLSQKRILVVDDNRMNRLLAATILKNYGAIITEAVNGEEAIDFVKGAATDLVLMDIQMPVMDGMEATSLIRKWISKTIPIIALTANAIKGDNDKCIDAGMNAYLSKPFKEKDLLDVVAFWLNKSKAKVNTGVLEYGSPDQLYNLQNIKELSQGNDAFVKKLVQMFIAQTPLQVAQMEEKFAARDYKAIGLLAHSMKPVIDNLGIVCLKEVVREVEKKGKQETPDPGIIEQVMFIKKIIGLVVSDLEVHFPMDKINA
ncbi:ATP-binding protein [Ferruginibacter paludis]|uniref:ATP-binding protein n=1 Tax=Ferruginibacter paludis TaxID=1310417 RepID=UPI0025B2BABB|nr:ATP-binding protein [Ferruginibacter paludis]MDN3654651.1 ATP-binding protein [Ferruginibacter paludis]